MATTTEIQKLKIPTPLVAFANDKINIAEVNWALTEQEIKQEVQTSQE